MAEAFERRAAVHSDERGEDRSWASRMSDHVAFALLTYTGLQIFVTMLVLKSNHSSILPYFALVVLVFAIIPAARAFEMRWTELPESRAHDPALAGEFKRDRALVWTAAILAPLAITALIKGVSTLL